MANESIDQDYLQSLKNKLNELNNVIQSMATKTKKIITSETA